jgi:DNA ligase-1
VVNGPTIDTHHTLDGELYCSGWNVWKIAHTVRSDLHKFFSSGGKFYTFDVISAGDLTLQTRLDLMNSIVEDLDSPFVVAIPHQNIANIAVFLDNIVKVKGEGIVCKDPYSKYTGGRTKKWLKIKPTYFSQCRISGYVPGKGKHSNMLGSVKCVPIDQPSSVLHIGHGITESERVSSNFPLGATMWFKYNSISHLGVHQNAVIPPHSNIVDIFGDSINSLQKKRLTPD